MIKFSCFNVIIHNGKNGKLIGYCLYNHSNKSMQVFSLFESVLQMIDDIRRQEQQLVSLVFSKQGIIAKYKKYLIENIKCEGSTTHTEQELIDLANAHCRFYKNRQHLLPIKGIKKAVDYFRCNGFRVHTLYFKN